jgi:hypothetical protein
LLTIRGLPARKVNEVIMELGVLMEQVLQIRNGTTHGLAETARYSAMS